MKNFEDKLTLHRSIFRGACGGNLHIAVTALVI